MITARQAAFETERGVEKQAGLKQKRLYDAVEWAIDRIAKAAELGQYRCELGCRWPLGHVHYSSRWPKEFTMKVVRHLRAAGFQAELRWHYVLAPQIYVSWGHERISEEGGPHL